MSVTVVIPVKNGADTLTRCLASIREQSLGPDIEIILLDSGSTDDSLIIAAEFDVVTIPVNPVNFNHGITRNLAVSHASNDHLFYTVQDAWLSDPLQLAKMVSHFNDPQVDAVVGHQAVPWGHPDKNPVAWYRPYTTSEVVKRQYEGNSFMHLTPEEQLAESYWDNVNAMYRKEVLTEIPFPETNYSEDWFWANMALKAGKTILRDSSLVVYHYHHMNFGYTFKTELLVDYNFSRRFNRKKEIQWSPVSMLRSWYTILKRKEVPMLRKPYWLFHNSLIHFAKFSESVVFKLGNMGKGRWLDDLYQKITKSLPQGRQYNS